MRLRSAPKRFRNLKCDSPENTIERVVTAFKRFGLEIEYVPMRRSMIPGMSTPLFGVYSGKAFLEIPFSFRTNGKGTSDLLARASAHAEAAERFSTAYVFDRYVQSLPDKALAEALLTQSYLPGYVRGHQDEVAEAIPFGEFLDGFGYDPETIAAFAAQPYAQHWVAAYSLTEEALVRVPIRFVWKLGSNGMAAGNTLEEAIVHGACEIFERYVLFDIVRNRRELPTVDPRTIDNPRIQKYLASLREAGIEAIIKDASLGNRFPCLGVLFVNHNLADAVGTPKHDLYYRRLHLGSDPSRDIALERCFTEEIENRGLRELRFHDLDDDLWAYWTEKMGRSYVKPEHGYESMLRRYDCHDDLSFLEVSSETTSHDTLFDWQHTDCLDDVRILIEVCRREGQRLLVVDVTHPTLDFPAVWVVIPGFSAPQAMYGDLAPDLEPRGKLPAGERILQHEIHRLCEPYHGRSPTALTPEQKVALSRSLIEACERYLSGHLPNPVMLDSGLCLLSALAYANLGLGNYRDAYHYLHLKVLSSNVKWEQEEFSEILGMVQDALIEQRPEPETATRSAQMIMERLGQRIEDNPFGFLDPGEPGAVPCETASQLLELASLARTYLDAWAAVADDRARALILKPV